MKNDHEPVLFDPQVLPAPVVRRVDASVVLRDVDGLRVVLFRGAPIFTYDSADRQAEKGVVMSLRRNFGVQQQDAAAAFGYGVSTIRNWEAAYRAGGLPALGRKQRERTPIKVDAPMEAAVRKGFENGLSDKAIGARLGVHITTVWRTRRRLGLRRERRVDASLPNMELDEQVGAPEEDSGARAQSEADHGGVDEGERAAAEPSEAAGEDDRREMLNEEVSLDSDPTERRADRALACAGLLQEAAPLFGDAEQVPGAGVLLALPLIAACEVLRSFENVYGRLRRGFYGLRSTVLMLLFMALLRIRRIEQLKERCPRRLGWLVGLDRFAEVKTLRRKLSELASKGKAVELMTELAKQRTDGLDDDALGVLYVDGHVREYYGKRKLSQTHVARRNHVAKAVTDTWVNDANGDPLFVVTSELNQGLVGALPAVLDEARKFIGDRALTVAFDRGGWSQELFVQLIEDGFDLITYRKGKAPELPPESFHIVSGPAGQLWPVHEMSVRIGQAVVHGADGEERPLWLRQITRLRDDGAQTQVVTTLQQMQAAEVLRRMFDRWRQENFFKYMMREFALDALVDHAASPASEELTCPNPERKRLQKQIGRLRKRLKKLQADLGDRTAKEPSPWWRSVKCFKSGQAETLQTIRSLELEIEGLRIRRLKLPERVPASESYERLVPEKKLITDAIKMTAYQVESGMLEMLRPHYARCEDEGRKLIAAALQAPADVHVSDGELHIALHPMSSAHRTQAIRVLCEQLDAMAAIFPGTDLRLRYSIQDA
jgi:transposase